MCSSPMVYAPTEGPPHGSIEQNSLENSVVSSCCSRDRKNGDRKPLLLEGKQLDEVEKSFFQGRDFPLPGSHEHEQIRNKLRKYIREMFMEYERFPPNETDEKGVCSISLKCDQCLSSAFLTYVLPPFLTFFDPLLRHYRMRALFGHLLP